MNRLVEYLQELYATLDAEVDLHGSRTEMAYNIRQLIIEAEKELEK